MNLDTELVLLASTPAWPLLIAVAMGLPAFRSIALRLVPTAALPALLTALLPSTDLVLDLPWLLLGAGLGLDEVSRVYLLFSAILWTAGGLLLPDTDRRHFCVWFLVTMTSSFTVLLARDIPFFFLSYAVMSLATFGLVIHERTAEARHAARVYLIFAVIGEMVLLAAMILVAHNAATLDLELIVDRAPHNLLMALLLIGFGIKSGVPLLHMALPGAYAVTPQAAVVPMAGALLHLGLYGWMRFLPLGQTALPEWSAAFACIGTVAVLYGVAVGLTQREAKSLLAYSSISQMGLIMIGIGIALSSPDHWQVVQPVLLLFALHHALAKGALFHGLSIGKRGRISLWLPALALAGLPFSGGALVKGMWKAQVHLLPEGWSALSALVLPVSSMGTALLMARFLYLAMSKEPSRGQTTPLSWWLLLAGMLLLPWIWPLPLERLSPLWSAVWPVLLAAGPSWLAYQGVFAGLLSHIPALPPGDLLIPVERLLQRIPLPDTTHPAHQSEHSTELRSPAVPAPIAITERFLGQWQVTVGLLLFLILGLFLLLAGN